MQTKTVEKVIKRSLVYSMAITQPFTVNQVLSAPLQDVSFFEQNELQYGDHGQLVRHAQLKLKKLGYYEDKIDGIYGLYTEQAVRSFQSSETISINGIINEETFTNLIESEKKEAIKQISTELQSISYGDVNDDVTKVQEVLYFYGYYRGNIDGIYGPLTEKAIEEVVNEQLISQSELEITNSALDNEQTIKIKNETKNEHVNNEIKNTDLEQPTIIPLDITYNGNDIIQQAKSFIGTPYVWGGTSPGGFDCSGFIQYVYKQNDLLIPRTVSDIWNFSEVVSAPSIGDLVFFETYQPGPSHMGIYLGKGNFIHAGSSRGVEISNFNDNNYWKTRYLGAKRIH